MRNKRNNRYGIRRFSTAAILGLVFGILGWLLFLVSLVRSIVTKGEASALFGYLFLSAIVFGVWGTVFSICAWNAEEGTLGTKRFLVLFNIVLLVLSASLMLGSFF